MTKPTSRSFLRLTLAIVALAALCVTSASPTFSQSDTPSLPTRTQVLTDAQRVNNYWIANRPGPEDNEWSRAVYFTGNMAHYQMTGDEQYLNHAWQWAEGNNWQLNRGCTTVFADDQAAGQTYLSLHAIDPQRADLTCLLNSIETSTSWGWVEVDLGATVRVNRIALDTFENRAYRYLVDVKHNPSDPYTTLLDRADGQLGESPVPSTPARFVRLRVIGAAGYSGEWVSLNEFQLFGEAEPATNLALHRPTLCSSEPQPENACANVVDGNVATRWSTSFPTNFSDSSPNWWWIDALYMAAPIYATLSTLEAQGALDARLDTASTLYAKYDETKQQRGLYDAAAGLWVRDSRFLTMRSPNNQKIFWSRGNGWVFAAHARILETLPTTDPHYAEYLSTFQAMADALLAVQDEAGYWNENLADPNHCGGPESSGTAFFAYGMAWGINHGHLARAEYLPAVIRAWSWLSESALQDDPDGLLGYVQAIGDAPVCDANAPLPTAGDTADFGVGAFLLAASEVVKLAAPDAFSSTLRLPMIAQ